MKTPINKKDISDEIDQLNSKLSIARNKLLAETIDDEDYIEIKKDLKGKIEKLEDQLSKDDSESKSVNINVLIDKGLESITNLGKLYKEGGIKTKKDIIGSIFPEKLEFNGKVYRTTRMNVIAHRIFQINNELGGYKKRRNDCDNHFSCLVAIPGVSAHAPDLAFDVEHFKYNNESDTYTCPANEILTTNGNWYNKTNGKSITKMKHYKTSACLFCACFTQCTKNKKGRLIERSQYTDLIYQNKVRIENNYEIYRKRQAIVEQPYGVIKRQWGFYYIMTKKTIKHASADVGLIFTAYNLRRILNLIDQNLLKQYLKILHLFILAIRPFFKAFYEYTFSYPKRNIYSEKYLTVA